jgi:hypothetical protein
LILYGKLMHYAAGFKAFQGKTEKLVENLTGKKNR